MYAHAATGGRSMAPPELFAAIALALFGCGIGVSLVITDVARLKRVEHEIAHGTTPRGMPPELEARLARIEQIVEVTAVEVERVSEAQRWVARQIAEQETPRLPASRGGA